MSPVGASLVVRGVTGAALWLGLISMLVVAHDNGLNAVAQTSDVYHIQHYHHSVSLYPGLT